VRCGVLLWVASGLAGGLVGRQPVTILTLISDHSREMAHAHQQIRVFGAPVASQIILAPVGACSQQPHICPEARPPLRDYPYTPTWRMLGTQHLLIRDDSGQVTSAIEPGMMYTHSKLYDSASESSLCQNSYSRSG
jgi:hypothetical protein